MLLTRIRSLIPTAEGKSSSISAVPVVASRVDFYQDRGYAQETFTLSEFLLDNTCGVAPGNNWCRIVDGAEFPGRGSF